MVLCHQILSASATVRKTVFVVMLSEVQIEPYGIYIHVCMCMLYGVYKLLDRIQEASVNPQNCKMWVICNDWDKKTTCVNTCPLLFCGCTQHTGAMNAWDGSGPAVL